MTDRDQDLHDAPVDAHAAERVAARGLRLDRVDGADHAQVGRWFDAVTRGFLEAAPAEARRRGFIDQMGYQRKLGVYDAQAPQPDEPVATFASWTGELTVPGGAMPVRAITSVTVAPTHRRRGLLRSMMAGELRLAAEHGLPAAALTVSESTIYGRFGFGPAVLAATWELDVPRARWVGPDAPGRVDFVSRAQGRALVEPLHERFRRVSPGELSMPGGHWDRIFGTRPDADKADQLRVVQYRSVDDAGVAGDVEGVAVYKATENADDFTKSAIDVILLLAVTEEAYAGLWHFFLSMDLIGTLRASELAVDEPLWWMIADQRAARITGRDHQYLRILDVPAALASRRYDVAETVVLEVADSLEIADGTFVLTTDAGGTASVDVVDDAPVGVPLVRLGVAELSSVLLGGVSPVALARAGRIQTDDPALLARMFATPAAPRLSFWY
ncbi:GNAT family N-acetyltransferase [Microbacterium dextranolyticum]|uniref:UPF0256 protein n=1 Tax=Microbacterium dextranolyticum TaxID=36806 RepID=A0A9W6M6D6_9MICO|nr:GNAT family N-acetyltransferase [Microbacterium dextranolyticum]MBM7463408.1 putative acetyltransferase [Microbacterium dextranolyticum]GLJ95490.1 UPF0256 protein [Microbacterium dextranolyticum]